jgi:NAD(P)-dependent dehydrogenase (short-subunit alcohol dehydrogenase family)
MYFASTQTAEHLQARGTRPNSLSQDLAGSGIHTCCVCPGFTDTEMMRAHVGSTPLKSGSESGDSSTVGSTVEDGDNDVLQRIAQLSTFGRLIDTNEIADVLLFAARNPVLNGSVIHANLGQVSA